MDATVEQGIDTELVLRWIEALESGKYPQTTGVLRDDQGYCCLGVLSDVVDPNAWQESTPGDLYLVGDDEQERNPKVWGASREVTGLAPSIQDRIGLNVDGARDDRSPWLVDGEESEFLTNINDHGGSFAGIAAALREHYGLPKDVVSK